MIPFQITFREFLVDFDSDTIDRFDMLANIKVKYFF